MALKKKIIPTQKKTNNLCEGGFFILIYFNFNFINLFILKVFVTY
jgi:hypothetical protein